MIDFYVKHRGKSTSLAKMLIVDPAISGCGGGDVTSVLPYELLCKIMSWLTDDADWVSVNRVCVRWYNAAKSEFDMATSQRFFHHALYIDQRRFIGVLDPETVQPAALDIMCRTVFHPTVIQQCASIVVNRFPQQWFSFLLTAVTGRNSPCIEALFSSLRDAARQATLFSTTRTLPPPMDSSRILELIRAIPRGCDKTVIDELINGLRSEWTVALGTISVVLIACLDRREDVLETLLDHPDFCRPRDAGHVLRYALHSGDHQTALMLVNAKKMRPALAEVMNSVHGIYYLKETCKRKWETVVNLLLGIIYTEAGMATMRNDDDDDDEEDSDYEDLLGENRTDMGTAVNLNTILRFGVVAGQISIVSAILSHGTCKERRQKTLRSSMSDMAIGSGGRKKKMGRGIEPGHDHNIALREALEMGHLDIAKLLLGDSRINVNNYTCEGNSVLCCAVKAGHAGEILTVIINKLDHGGINQFNHAPVRLAIDGANYDAISQMVVNCPDLVLSKDEVGCIFKLIGSTPAYTPVATRLIRDKRFNRMLGWSLSAM